MKKKKRVFFTYYYSYTEYSDQYFGLEIVLLDVISDGMAERIGKNITAYSQQSVFAGPGEIARNILRYYTGSGLRNAMELAVSLDSGEWDCDEGYYWESGAVYLKKGLKILWIHCEKNPEGILEGARILAGQWLS